MPALPVSLEALLKAGGVDAVARLLTERPDLQTQRIGSLRDLAWAASYGESLSACFLGLDALEHLVVQALVAAPEPVTLTGVTALLGVEQEAVRRVLARLEVLGIAALRGAHVWVLDQVRSLELPHHGPPASMLLTGLPVDKLKAFAPGLGVVVKGLKKPQLVAALVHALSRREVVANVVARGPAGTAALMDRLLEQPRTEVPWTSPFAKQPATPIGWLREHGLLLTTPNRWDVAVVPREVGLAFADGRLVPVPPPAQPPDLSGQVVDDPRAAEHCVSNALQVVAQVRALCAALGSQPALLLASGGVGVREVRRLAKQLRASDRDVARRLELAAAAGLLALDHAVDGVVPTPAFDDWQELTLAERWTVLVQAWLALPHHPSEALRVSDNGKASPALLSRPSRTAVVQRESVLSALASTGERVMPEPLRARLLHDRPGAWQSRPDSLLLDLLVETDDLGLTSLGWLGPLGRALVESGVAAAATLLAEQAPPAAEAFVISGDLTALVPGDLSPPVAAELSLLADLESDGTAKLFRFTEASVRRAFDAGRSVDEVLGYLSAHAVHGVPQPLDYLVRDLGRRHGQLRVGALGSFCRCDDPALVRVLLSDRRLGALSLRELAPGLLGADAAPDELVSRLRAAGYLPVQEGADGAVVPAAPVALRSGPRSSRPRPASEPLVDVAALAARIVAAAPVVQRSLSAESRPEHEVDRPRETERDPMRVFELLDNAEYFDWGLEVVHGGLRAHGWVTDLERGRLVMETFDGLELTMRLKEITAARVLDEDEEDRLLS